MITLANKLAAYLGRELGKSEDEIEVMAYGFIGLIQMLCIYLITSVISLKREKRKSSYVSITQTYKKA